MFCAVLYGMVPISMRIQFKPIYHHPAVLLRTAFSALLIGVILLWSPVHARKSKVMVVNSYHAEHPWVQAHNGALKTQLAAKADLTIVNLDTKRVSPGEYQVRAEIAYGRVVLDSPDVVVLTDDNAVKLLGKKVMALGIPVVFLGVNENPRTYLGNMYLATGVLERPLYKRSLVYLQDIVGVPLRKCLILFDSGTTAQVILESVFKGKLCREMSNIVTDIRLLDTFEDWQIAVQSAKSDGYDIMFAGLYHTLVDENGDHVPSEKVIRWTSKHSTIPVFAYWDFAVGKGMAVGGLVNSGATQGEEGAKLVLRILDGERPDEIYPVTANHGQFIISRHEMRRWNIAIPDNFRPASKPVRFVE